MARTKASDSIYTVNGSRTDCIKIAMQLGYPDEVILKLDKAKTDFERSSIMAEARKNGKTYEKKKDIFGRSYIAVEEPPKRKPKEEVYEQVTWKRTTK